MVSLNHPVIYARVYACVRACVVVCVCKYIDGETKVKPQNILTNTIQILQKSVLDKSFRI